MLSQAFQDAQKQWMEDMASNTNKLCDTTFILGPQKTKMYGLRALLANISPVFRAQLYGNFMESSLDEMIEYPTILPSVFKCILRVSFGLDPLITEHVAVPLIEAAHMLQIEPLQRECQYYLSHCINEQNVLFLLNSAYCLSSLDSSLYSKCRSMILQSNAYSILLNEGFNALHPDLMIDIISCDDFKAKEEDIWNACFKWAQNVIDKSLKFERKSKNILQRLHSETRNTNHDIKDCDNDNDDDTSGTLDLSENDYYDLNSYDGEQQMQHVLQPIVPYIRYPLMEKAFFIENVCKYLSRTQSESVLIYFILSQRSIFCHEMRKSFVTFDVVAASKEFESAKKLPDLSQDSLFCSQAIKDETEYQWFVMDILFVGVIKAVEIKNRYSDKDTVKSMKLQLSSRQDTYSEGNEHWIDVQKFESARSNSWQTFNVNAGNINNRTSRYWRIVLLDTYGGYTCLNHIKLTMQPV
eukprot:197713_1